MKTAVVTGAGSGIGEAIARRLLADGWSVLGWDRRPGELEGVTWRQVDVTEHEQVMTAAGELDSVDVLVNCAGVGGIHPAAELPHTAWQRIIGVNLSGAFSCCQALFPALSAGGGLVVNLASVMAHRATPGRAAYSASKAGLVMLTEVLGLEWAEHGIRVVAVSPGYTNTPLVRKAIANGNLDEERLVAEIALRRLAEPDEVAEVVHDLASGRLAYLTATTIRLDGGWGTRAAR